MSPTETPAEHMHDWGDASCRCGDTAYAMIARYRETLEEYVVALREARAASWQGDFQDACRQREAAEATIAAAYAKLTTGGERPDKKSPKQTAVQLQRLIGEVQDILSGRPR